MDQETECFLRQLQNVDRSSLPDDDARVKILKAAQGLCQRLETPFEWVMRMTWQEPMFTLGLKVADDIHLFSALGPKGGPPKTANDLAASTATQPALLSRILRHLAANGVVGEEGGEQTSYSATEVSEVLASDEGSSGIRHSVQIYHPILRHGPDYLKSIDYAVPKDNKNAAFQHSVGQSGQSYFDWLQAPENKAAARDFNLLMTYTVRYRKSWMETFPADRLLKGESNQDLPILVDIGGGMGTEVLEFRRRFPHVRGRVILQELPNVIEMAKEKNQGLTDQHVEYQIHDFFTPQKVHGARIYFMGSVLHDWPDAEARKILRNLAPAMKKGYSTLLLNENVISAAGCHPHLSALDLTMMTLFGAQERTEAQWREMLMLEGFKLVAAHSIPSSWKTVLEVELA